MLIWQQEAWSWIHPNFGMAERVTGIIFVVVMVVEAVDDVRLVECDVV